MSSSLIEAYIGRAGGGVKAPTGDPTARRTTTPGKTEALAARLETMCGLACEVAVLLRGEDES